MPLWNRSISLLLPVVLLVLGSASLTTIRCQASAEAVPAIQKVMLFKNGLGYYIARAELPSGSKSVTLGSLPIPIHGTLWVSYPKGLHVRSVIASQKEEKKNIAVAGIIDILRGNTGHKVDVTLKGNPPTVVTGILEGIRERRTNPPEPGEYTMGSALSGGNPVIERPDAGVVVLKTSAGVTAIGTESISRVDLGEEAKRDSTTYTVTRPVVRIELESAARGEDVTLSYVARGITWAPAYQIDLSDPDKAHFSAHAVVMNELCDLQDVAVDLVTGFPNILFESVKSPMGMSQNLRDFLSTLSMAGSRPVISYPGAMTQSNTVVIRGMQHRMDESSLPDYPAAPEGASAEDLFFYPEEKFSLKKGETAWLPLFSAQMPYKHVYTWKIDDQMQAGGYYPVQRPDGEPKPEEIWHCCRLKNTLSLPLTTAPVEFTTDGRFTGQDLCKFTPPGGETTIKLNKALNLVAEQTEVEVSRQRNAERINGTSYDKVRLRGELSIRNMAGKQVVVEITKDASGEVIETSPKAKDVPTATGLRQVNTSHTLTWEISLDKQGRQQVTYVVDVLVRN